MGLCNRYCCVGRAVRWLHGPEGGGKSAFGLTPAGFRVGVGAEAFMGPSPRQSGGVRSRAGAHCAALARQVLRARRRADVTDLATAAARPPRTVDPGGTVAAGRRARPGGSALAQEAARARLERSWPTTLTMRRVTSAYSSARMRSAIAAPHATPRRAGSPSPVASHPLPWCARTRSQAQGGACLARRGRSARLRPEITPSSGRQAGSVPLCGCPLSSTDARLF